MNKEKVRTIWGRRMMKRETFYTLITAVAFFAIGIVGGMLLQQSIFQSTLMGVAGNMDGVTFNIEFNETLMMEIAMEEMEDIVWEMRMENCTRTEKNYCALQCYENKKLIPCENFTMDEHFCNEGICEVDGVCPGYFEVLDGKTLGDCIRDVEFAKLGMVNQND